MKFWPFGRETRAVGSYTELLIEAAYAQVSGGVASASTAAREIASGHWARAFASADLSPIGQVSDALRPYLGYVGRELIHTGEAIFAIDFDGGLRLTPASGYTVMGTHDSRTWVYDLTLPGPTSTTTRTLPGDRVLHLTYATDSVQPWKGIGPLESAQATVALLSGLETQLGQEANSASGQRSASSAGNTYGGPARRPSQTQWEVGRCSHDRWGIQSRIQSSAARRLRYKKTRLESTCGCRPAP